MAGGDQFGEVGGVVPNGGVPTEQGAGVPSLASGYGQVSFPAPMAYAGTQALGAGYPSFSAGSPGAVSGSVPVDFGTPAFGRGVGTPMPVSTSSFQAGTPVPSASMSMSSSSVTPLPGNGTGMGASSTMTPAAPTTGQLSATASSAVNGTIVGIDGNTIVVQSADGRQHAISGRTQAEVDYCKVVQNYASQIGGRPHVSLVNGELKAGVTVIANAPSTTPSTAVRSQQVASPGLGG